MQPLSSLHLARLFTLPGSPSCLLSNFSFLTSLSWWFLVLVPSLLPVLPPPGSLPHWPSVPTSEADDGPSHLHNYSHFPLPSTSSSAGIFCLLVQIGGPHLLNVVSLHRSVLQSPTAHSEVSLDQRTAEHCSQEHGWALESNLISPLHDRVTKKPQYSHL